MLDEKWKRLFLSSFTTALDILASLNKLVIVRVVEVGSEPDCQTQLAPLILK